MNDGKQELTTGGFGGMYPDFALDTIRLPAYGVPFRLARTPAFPPARLHFCSRISADVDEGRRTPAHLLRTISPYLFP